MSNVLAERELVTHLREGIDEMHVLGAAAYLAGQPGLERQDSCGIVEREVEDLCRRQPTDVNDSRLEQVLLQNAAQVKQRLLGGRCSCRRG